ncbi:GNAT family N-acetyltransferase [Kordiimonas lipolytica]|uniref:GNAT family N-acetyltransferase n=1 Tax=Kordiimonas lipolytica TaxID=1662421 RepID=A0ABV8UCR4_9PROT|nr:GNAT family N-acetyltransferase [Kordiimonas lipolytica]
MKIEQIANLTDYLPAFVDMLVRTVGEGASIGFHAPLEPEEAEAYWHDVNAALKSGQVWMLIAHVGDKVIGSVQLAPCMKANGRHRAEVQKLMVHPDARGIGVGRNLMIALERLALEKGRTLLMLDTATGDIAEGLYSRMGYTCVGTVPHYTIEADDSFGDTTIFYKHLDPTGG